MNSDSTAPRPAPAPGNSGQSGRPFAPRPGSPPSRGGSRPFDRRGRPPHGRGGGRGGARPGGVRRRIERMLRRPNSAPSRRPQGADYFPEPATGDTVRIVPLGGIEEVGRNMTVVEANGDIFVLDAGFQFVSEDGSPGVDYILPNTKYLEKNKDRVRAVIITHGHLDHIGGIPFLLPRFGNPPIYTQSLTAIMIQKRQEEYPDVPKPEIVIVEVGQ